MKEVIARRVLQTAEHIAQSGQTVRESARLFGISKTTVHKDMRERLPKLDERLAREVAKVLNYNKATRHLRGGLATRKKYRLRQENARRT